MDISSIDLRRQPMLGNLPGDQVPDGDLLLLLRRVAGQLDDLHPVIERPGDIPNVIGRGDEQHVGEINCSHFSPFSFSFSGNMGIQYLYSTKHGGNPLYAKEAGRPQGRAGNSTTSTR